MASARSLERQQILAMFNLTEEDVATQPRSTCRDLVPVPPGTCPSCGTALHTGSSVQPALFVHGGFGEARCKTERSCDCGWNGIGQGDYYSVNPRKLA